MNEHFIDLMDGTRLPVKVNFGTLFYMQKRKGFYRINKKAENEKKLTDNESFEMTANVVYAMLRSNGKTVSFDEALALIPPDPEGIENALKAFKEEYDAYVKKKQAKQEMMNMAK